MSDACIAGHREKQKSARGYVRNASRLTGTVLDDDEDGSLRGGGDEALALELGSTRSHGTRAIGANEFHFNSLDESLLPMRISPTAARAALFSRDLLFAENAALEVTVRDSLRAIGMPRYVGEPLVATLDRLYKTMLREYPSEYVFKNELVNRLLVSRKSSAGSTVLTEMRVGKNRVDLVFVNGLATAIEVKTRFDSLDRLAAQVATYLKVFDRVIVACSPEKVMRVAAIVPTMVGISVMNCSGSFTVVRKPSSVPTLIDRDAVFACLRQDEYCSIIKRRFEVVPRVPNMLLRRECRALFATLDDRVAAREFASVLRARGRHINDSHLVTRLPYAFRHAYFQLPPSSRPNIAVGALATLTP